MPCPPQPPRRGPGGGKSGAEGGPAHAGETPAPTTQPLPSPTGGRTAGTGGAPRPLPPAAAGPSPRLARERPSLQRPLVPNGRRGPARSLPSAPPAAGARCPGPAAPQPAAGAGPPAPSSRPGRAPPSLAGGRRASEPSLRRRRRRRGRGKRRPAAGTASGRAARVGGGTHLRPRPCPREPRGGRGQPVSNSKDVSGSGSPLKYGRSLPRSRPRGSPRPSAAAAHAPAALSGKAGPPMAAAAGPPRP